MIRKSGNRFSPGIKTAHLRGRQAQCPDPPLNDLPTGQELGVRLPSWQIKPILRRTNRGKKTVDFPAKLLGLTGKDVGCT
jgi:hypothetical protein